MKHALVPFKVTHRRLVPKRYEFIHNFFWFKVNLDNPSSWPTHFVSFNRFNLYSFFDKDHLKLGKESARENYIDFLRSHGVTQDIKNVTMYTQLRFLGYVFNPISLVVLTDSEDKRYAVIEIGNTFNELKPFFVDSKYFKDNNFLFQSKKYFYISPFIAHDNLLTYSVRHDGHNLNIYIEDSNEEETVLQVSLSGHEVEATTFELLKQTAFIPFITFKIIGLIHWHALVLWMKKIRYYKKNDHLDLQQGTFKWKE
jgi:uncharacterized protein